MAEIREVKVPDIGDFDAVEIVEVLVSPGDRVQEEDSLITLESDKATMDVPSPLTGTVKELKVATGDEVAEGDVILTLELAEEDGEEEGEEKEEKEAKEAREEEQEEEEEKKEKAERPEKEPEKKAKEETAKDKEEPDKKGLPEPAALDEEIEEEAFLAAHASPSVRRFARELGADLSRVEGSGRKGRITREDVESYVKQRLQGPERPAAGALALPEMPEVDFDRFGDTERIELPRIRKIGARNLHRSWLHVPHVTQHDEADVTELEEFRKAHGAEAEERGFKLTPIAFLMKASVGALKKYPDFNSSLDPDGEHLIRKHYYHLGIAVDTPNGLTVPVIRDVDRKGLFQCAEELVEVAGRARDGKLKKDDIEGATFTISSLGGIGGTAFTPIVNAPEVAILGASKMEWKPVWRDGEFVPRRILPLSLSYDHRVIDGAAAARFTTYLARVLSDLRMLLL